MADFENAIRRVRRGEDLEAEEMAGLIGALLDGAVAAGEAAVGELLVALHAKGETAGELVGAARAMRAHMTPIRNPQGTTALLDTCGTGGSGSGTFNISTAAAIVISSAGVAVAKHGNRRATSRSGSADVLSELGVRIESDRETVERLLAELNLCFCFAPVLHPAMRHVAEIRRSLGVPTLFNLLGPLCNPAGATHQLLGAGKTATQSILAEALAALGTTRSVVVRGEDGQDEVSLDGTTTAIEVRGGDSPETLTHAWTAATFGLSPSGADALQAADPAESARIIGEVLEGRRGPCRDIVLANAATGLWLVERCRTLREGVELAADRIDSGAARQQLERFVAASQTEGPLFPLH
ncbi:anthranilate phosphoribosyltransferase [Candidatus Laterigemmans baculatus]|uniref:anthranilate phosphoribosyltransferase n=1 Tax=Candidatus Laterigemmans baculatus TaxID=2770505 RepID=UPI0013DAB05C|nr:anthranilate phosphoribosyltransferase [Candidatus Laterigemmans baculatus]